MIDFKQIIAESIAQITNLQYGEEILSTLPAVFEIKHLLYFVDIILIIATCKLMKIKFQKKENKTKKKVWKTAKILIKKDVILVNLDNPWVL